MIVHLLSNLFILIVTYFKSKYNLTFKESLCKFLNLETKIGGKSLNWLKQIRKKNSKCNLGNTLKLFKIDIFQEKKFKKINNWE